MAGQRQDFEGHIRLSETASALRGEASDVRSDTERGGETSFDTAIA